MAPTSGRSTAASVHVKDSLPEGCKLLEGELDFTIPKISSGTRVNRTYVVVFLPGNTVRSFPHAVVNYQAEADGDSRQASGKNSCMHA